MKKPTDTECLTAFTTIEDLLLAGEPGQALTLARAMAFDLSVSIQQEKGHAVHHIDGNPRNNSISNVLVVDL